MSQYSTGNVESEATVVQGHDINIQIYKGSAFSPIDYTADVTDLLDYYSEQFVGREAVFEQIDAILAQPETRYLLVEANAGFGKSALMAQLVRRSERGKWPKQSRPRVAFFFIREEGLRNTPEAFLSAINSQLLYILNSSGGVPITLEAQRAQFTYLWKAAASAAAPEHPLLLLIDGLDEIAMGKITIANLLPSFLTLHTRVVIFSRPNPRPQETAPIEHPLRKANVIRLDPLRLQDIEALLRQEGSDTRMSVTVAPRILELTRGEPLFVRFVCEDVSRVGEQALLNLGDHPPEQVEEYFQQQFQELDSQVGGDIALDLLGLMLVSRGPMAIEEMAGALRVSPRQARRAVEPIQRFLIGSERFELMHLQLRKAIAKDFSEEQRDDYRRKLLAWCRSFNDNGWPATTPDYVLEHFAEHLREVNDRPSIYALVSRRWMRLKAARTYSNRSFAGDVLLAVDMAASEHPPNLVQEFRCSLAYATLCSLAANVPEHTLGLLAQTGQLPKAMGYASLIPDLWRRSTAYCAIGRVLANERTSEQAMAAAKLSLVEAGRIEEPGRRAAALGGVADVFARAGDRARAEEVLEQALTAAEELNPGRDRRRADRLDDYARAVAGVANAASGLGANAHLIEVVAAALEKVAVPLGAASPLLINGSPSGVRLVAALARLGRAEQALGALGPAEAGQRNAVIADAIKEFAEEGEADRAAELASRAVAAGQLAPGGAYRLTDAVSALALAGKPDPALAVALLSAEPEDEAQALAAVTLAFAQAGDTGQAKRVAEEAVRQIKATHVNSRPVALEQVAEMLSRAGEGDLAADIAENTLSALPGADAGMVHMVLDSVALAFAWAGRTDRARQVAEQAQQMEQDTIFLSKLAEAFALIGDIDRAWALASEKSWMLSSVFRVLVSKGQPELLPSLVDKSPDPESRDKALASAAYALLGAGKIDEALTTARQIKVKSHQAPVINAALRALKDTSQPSQAVEIIDRHELLTATGASAFPDLSADDLTIVAEFLIQADDRPRAEKVLGYALTITETTQESQSIKTSELIAMADVFARAGDRARVEEMLENAAAGRIEEPAQRAAALGGVADVFARAGDRARAEEVLEGALAAAEELSPVRGRRPNDDLDRYALAVAGVARAAAMVGADPHLIQVLTAALDRVVVPLAAADQLPPNSGSGPAVGLVAALARLGRAEQALGALGPADPGQKNAVIADAVKELAEEGKADRAAELARQALAAGQIAEGGAYRLTDTVRALARVGQPGQALAMAERIAQPEEEAQALAAVTLAFFQAGEPGQARQVAERAVRQLRAAEVGSRLVALKQVAEMLARAGESDLAARAAEDMIHDVQQGGGLGEGFTLGKLLAAMAMTYMSPDMTDLADLGVKASQDALSIIAGGQSVEIRPYVVAAVALAFAWAGEAGQARQVAELARQPGLSTLVISDLARAYALTGDLDQAWALANESSWIPFFMFRAFLWKGQPEQLLSLADRSPDPESRDAVLTDAARALLEAGELDKALIAAQMITEKNRQASIKRSVLRTLSDTNQPSQTITLFREMLTIERSTGRPAVLHLLQTACSAIAKLDERATLWRMYKAMMDIDAELVGSSEM